jgi:outer membrane protein assembly factor BamA
MPVAQVAVDVTHPREAELTTETDSSMMLQVRDINISGNRRTKEYIIEREIHLKRGDTVMLSQLAKQLELARHQVYNTTLFTDVEIVPVTDSGFVDLSVTVKEKWYIYPVPVFTLVDRNFNEWLVKHKGDLSRVNYGLRFTHYNLSGRRDQLKLFLINGYSRNISLSYTNPYSNSKLTQGFLVAAGYSQTREVTYRTNFDHSVSRYNNGKFIYESWNVNAGYIFRKAIRRRHVVGVSYVQLNLKDSVIQKLNPRYFNDVSNRQGILDLSYTFQYINVDNVLYPLKGTTSTVGVVKRGLKWSGGTNMFSVQSALNKYFDLKKNWFASVELIGRIKLPFTLAYINQRSLGFGNAYLRGQEYFSIDAVAYGISKFTLKKQVAKFNLKTPFKSRNLNKIPFRLFAKTYGDVGYAYNKPEFRSRLNNKFLYSGGFGLDVLTLFDINFRFEYSFNQLGEKGLFLHNQSGF